MNTNNLSADLVIGVAALSLALLAGVWVNRRNRVKDMAGPLEENPNPEAYPGEEEQAQRKDIPDDLESIGSAPSVAPQNKLPLDYFVLVTVLTIPLWLFGGNPLPVPVKLPVSALSLFSPITAAIILTFRRDGLSGVQGLFQKVFDYRKIRHKIWYLPVLFLYPLIMVLSYSVMRLAGLPLPVPQIPWLMAPVMLTLFFIAAIGEELGWTGYATDPMQNRWGALKASIVLGVFWALFHLIPDMQNGQTADWILWHRLGTVAFRILIVWVYNNTGGSVFTAILFHATNNLSWTLFPNNGSHYDPFVTLMITLPVVSAVIIGWGTKTFSQRIYAGEGGI